MKLHGEIFPSWFSPNYPPVEPKKPEKPSKTVTKTTLEHVEDVYINDQKLSILSDICKKYDNDNYVINQNSSDFLSIFRKDLKQKELSTMEYIKEMKSYDKKMIEYQKSYNEFLLRSERYVVLYKKYIDEALETALKELKNELEEKSIALGFLEYEIYIIQKQIESKQKELNDARNVVV